MRRLWCALKGHPTTRLSGDCACSQCDCLKRIEPCVYHLSGYHLTVMGG